KSEGQEEGNQAQVPVSHRPSPFWKVDPKTRTRPILPKVQRRSRRKMAVRNLPLCGAKVPLSSLCTHASTRRDDEMHDSNIVIYYIIMNIFSWNFFSPRVP
ncbi:MAG: hypothetical protein ACREJK_11600, partial [Candidatus Methylomirabilales bacterium]